MDKFANLIKEAEVRGVVAGLVDAEHIKVASMEDMDALAAVVADSIEGTDYTLETVLAKTAEVIEAICAEQEAEEGLGKEASEGDIDETALMAALGELTMMKMAGQIDEETFEKEAASLGKLKDAAKAAGAAIKGAAKGAKDTFTGKARSDYAMHGALEDGYLEKLRKKRNQMVGARAAVGAGAAGAAVGGKALYDKHKK